MDGSMYEVVAYIMRYWFVFAMFVILIAVIYASVSEYRQRKYVMEEVGRYVGYLEIESGPEEFIGERRGIEKENTVGRLTRSDICINDYSVAKTHALLYQKGEDLYLSPMGRAITMVNGTRITKPQALRTGDVVTLGEIDVRVFIKRTRLHNDY
jgi:pSer/pThr/pTyr-binding forkhead associated (FHA) protein